MTAQYHYPALGPIVREVCKEYKLHYRILPSFAEAFRLHLLHLKEMGSVGQQAHMD